MADNSQQTGTDFIATDDITTLNGGAVTAGTGKAQRVKVGYGDDGIFRDVSATYPMPSVTPSATATGTITAANANIISGTATANSAVALTVPDGHSSWTIYVAGTFSAGTTLYTQGSLDGTNWFPLNGRRNTDAATNDTTNYVASDFPGGSSPLGSNPSLYRGNIGGIPYFRVTAFSYTVSDNVTVSIRTSAGMGATFLNNIPNFKLSDGTTAGYMAKVSSTGDLYFRKSSASTSTISSISSAVTSTLLLASNANRLGATFFNDSTYVLYLALSSTAASTTSYSVQLQPGGYFELPNDGCGYVGAVYGIWPAAAGAVRVTELSP